MESILKFKEIVAALKIAENLQIISKKCINMHLAKCITNEV